MYKASPNYEAIIDQAYITIYKGALTLFASDLTHNELGFYRNIEINQEADLKYIVCNNMRGFQ